MQTKLVYHNQLFQWCVRKLTQVGVNETHAETTVNVLIHANLRGVDSHGVMRLEHYVNKIKCGGINPRPDMKVQETGPVTAIVDGDDGLGHVVAERAMACAIEIAQKNGVGMVSAINSSHCGALSYFVDMAARNHLIGIAMTNTDKMVVPYGGSEAFFGTNPIAFAFPAKDNPPIVLDMATSSVAYGKILDARILGKPIPADWGVDDTGRPTTDPNQIAALLPFGGPKGYGLSMVVDILSGILTGSPFGPYVPQMYAKDLTITRKLGHLVLAINPAKFTIVDSFLQNMDQMIKDLHQMKPAPGFQEVLLPGEPEMMKELERRRSGIPIPEEIYQFLCS
jgi:ureidoglycolate dehydrogenase (NAD+)